MATLSLAVGNTYLSCRTTRHYIVEAPEVLSLQVVCNDWMWGCDSAGSIRHHHRFLHDPGLKSATGTQHSNLNL